MARLSWFGFAFFVWLILYPNAVLSQCVKARGMASTAGVELAFARQMAIRNALEIASMQNNLNISSRSEVENFALQRESTRFATNSKVRRFGIMSEYHDEEMQQYEVELDVCLTEDPNACGPFFGTHYQNRLVVAPVYVENAHEVRDISNLLGGYQNELLRRLREMGYYNLDLVDHIQGVPPGNLVTPNLSPEVLRPIQDQTGGQFLLLSVIRSASAHSENRRTMDSIRRFYDLETRDNRRYIEVDWYLVDLHKHRIVKQQREGLTLRGDARVGRERPFGTSAFFQTNTGQVFNTILNQQVQNVYDRLRCELLETEVIDVRNGDYVLFLSEESGVQVGDQLAVYQRSGNPVRFQGRNLGMDEEPSGFIRITRIMPKFAVGELVAENGRVQVGDVVRSW